MSSTQPLEAAGSVTSADGTTIGYRQAGDGPGIVLVHGGGQSSQNLMTLARALSGQFTVYVPDRRGRGMSGPYREGHGLRTEVEDLGALLDRTQAHSVFGLSVGATIAIEAARTLPAITRLALYEPPLEFDGVTQTSWLPRYERELAAGRLAAALVTILKGTADRTAFRLVPRFLLTSALGLVIRKTEGRPVPGEAGLPPMLPDATLPVPASLMTLLAAFAPLFTAPTFRTFCRLACGFLAQPGKRTVCGMLSGAGLARLWPHERAHWFFSGARWDPDELGLAVARLVVSLLVPAGEPVLVAVDDTLLKRRGKKVFISSPRRAVFNV